MRREKYNAFQRSTVPCQKFRTNICIWRVDRANVCLMSAHVHSFLIECFMLTEGRGTSKVGPSNVGIKLLNLAILSLFDKWKARHRDMWNIIFMFYWLSAYPEIQK